MPFAAGLLGSLLGTDDTYPLLKLVSEIGGFALLVLFATRAATSAGAGPLVALALVAVSPMLVDFSGNGSPYSWSGMALLATTMLLPRLRRGRGRDFALAGLLAGVAPQIHSSLFAVPGALLLGSARHWRRIPLDAASCALATCAVAVTPWIAWDLRHFGSAFYSYAPHVLWTNLGLAQEGIYGDVVTWRWTDSSWRDGLVAAVAIAGRSSVDMFRALLKEGGLSLGFAALGIAPLLRRDWRGTIERSLPVLLYIGLTLPFHFRDRFVVPLLPLVFLAAGGGFTWVWGTAYRSAAAIGAAAALIGMVPDYFESPPTRYYSHDQVLRAQYEAMLPVARSFASLAPGATLAYSATLDGGIEAAYYHRHVLVRGRSHGAPREARRGDLVRKLVEDFRVRYIWTDRRNLPGVRRLFAGARTVLGNGRYFVLEVGRSRSSGVCR